jgi:hypothetical protein
VHFKNGDHLSFRSHHGQYLVAEGDKKTVNANRGQVGPWEKWTVGVNGGSTISLKSAHGALLSAQPNGTLEANRPAVGPWEQFHVVLGQKGIGLKTAHNTFLCAEPNGTANCNRQNQDIWESFTIQNA